MGWFACSDRGVCPLALCGEMLAPVEEPLYLRMIWADIGGMPPPARRSAVKSTGAVEVARLDESSGPMRCPEEVECGAVRESTVLEEPETGGMEVARSGPTSGLLRCAEKVNCGESELLEDPKVNSGLPHL